MLDIIERAELHEQREQRRRDINGRERAHGGLVPGDREREQAARSAAGWGPYRPEVTMDDVRGVTAARRARVDRVSLPRLSADVRRAVARWAPKYRKDAAETLTTDAVLTLLRWEQQGEPDPLALGASGETPLLRDWIETRARADGSTERVLTRRAWCALHAAVKQAAESPLFLSTVESEHEQAARAGLDIAADDVLDIAAAVQVEQRESSALVRLPDGAAAETVAAALDISLDAARAIVSRAYPHASTAELAADWGVSEQAARNALTRGKRALRSRYPDPSDLLDALDGAAARWQIESESRAVLALASYRGGESSAEDAALAVADWRGALHGMSAERRALLAAARHAEQRNGGSYGSAHAERIALTVARLMVAEQRRGRRMATSGARGSHLSGGRALDGLPADRAEQHGRATVRSMRTPAARRWEYGLAARDDRERRAGARTYEPVPAHRAPAAGWERMRLERESPSEPVWSPSEHERAELAERYGRLYPVLLAEIRGLR